MIYDDFYDDYYDYIDDYDDIDYYVYYEDDLFGAVVNEIIYDLLGWGL